MQTRQRVALWVHQTSESDRTRADTVVGDRISNHRQKSEPPKHIQVTRSGLQLVVVEQFATEPRPIDIHAHTLKGDLDGRVSHLLRNVRSLARVRGTTSNAPKTPSEGTTSGPASARRLALVMSVTRRDFQRDMGPVVGLTGSDFDISWSGWDTGAGSEDILEGGSCLLPGETRELSLIFCNFRFVRLDLIPDHGVRMVENILLILNRLGVELCDTAFLHRTEVTLERVPGLGHLRVCIVEITPARNPSTIIQSATVTLTYLAWVVSLDLGSSLFVFCG